MQNLANIAYMLLGSAMSVIATARDCQSLIFKIVQLAKEVNRKKINLRGVPSRQRSSLSVPITPTTTNQ